jgi:hypothetical protein
VLKVSTAVDFNDMCKEPRCGRLVPCRGANELKSFIFERAGEPGRVLTLQASRRMIWNAYSIHYLRARLTSGHATSQFESHSPQIFSSKSETCCTLFSWSKQFRQRHPAPRHFFGLMRAADRCPRHMVAKTSAGCGHQAADGETLRCTRLIYVARGLQ